MDKDRQLWEDVGGGGFSWGRMVRGLQWMGKKKRGGGGYKTVLCHLIGESPLLDDQ